MKILIIVRAIIENLTNDEDLKQELWLYYFEEGSADKLFKHYKKLMEKLNGIKKEFHR